jgi:hypothetical protein
MSAGDFLQAYTDTEQYDIIASAFFVDTARNIIAYIEVGVGVGPLDVCYECLAPLASRCCP